MGKRPVVLQNLASPAGARAAGRSSRLQFPSVLLLSSRADFLGVFFKGHASFQEDGCCV